MANKSKSLLDHFLLRAESAAQQVEGYARLCEQDRLSFQSAVEVAAVRMRDAEQKSEGLSLEFQTLFLAYDEYLPEDLSPSDQDIQNLRDAAATDYYAFVVLRWVAQFLDDASLPTLQDTKLKLAAGLLPVPSRPRGPDRYANARRDLMIIGEIERLVKVGFVPTRNKGAAAGESACDVIAAAMMKAGHPLSYAAVETVWARREKLRRPRALLKGFAEGLGLL